MKKAIHFSIIFIFVLLYLITSIISTIHSIDFFELSNSRDMSIFLAIAFEIGAAASLASIVTYTKMNKTLVWSIFIILTLFQIMNNVYYTFVNVNDYIKWIELFGLQELTQIEQARIISIVSGGVLPLIALGFIKSLVDYLQPTEDQSKSDNIIKEDNKNETEKFIEEINTVYNKKEKTSEKSKTQKEETPEDDEEKMLSRIRTGSI